MAKRKRLTPPIFTRFETTPKTIDPEMEAKSGYPMGVAPGAVTRAPIAQVAGDTATHAALEELVDEVVAARSEGRLVMDIALDCIQADHLLRDRMGVDLEEMSVLKSSLMARGQQAPIEVIELGQDRYGLISGWRRLTAFQELKTETGEGQFDKIQALIKPIKGAADSYVAMVEENEIRTGLSFYERARLAAEAAKLGVYPTPARAVQALFANAPSAKRSKITSFLRVHDNLGDVLQFPTAIPEKLGLALSKALERDSDLKVKARTALHAARKRTTALTSSEERKILENVLQLPGQTTNKGAPPARANQVTKDIALQHSNGCLILSGKGVTDTLFRELATWLSKR